MRSIILRGFDQQMAGLIKENMEKNGVNFIMRSIPTQIDKREDGSMYPSETHSILQASWLHISPKKERNRMSMIQYL